MEPGRLAWRAGEQFIYTRLDDDTMRFDWMISRRGAEPTIGDTLNCVRL